MANVANFINNKLNKDMLKQINAMNSNSKSVYDEAKDQIDNNSDNLTASERAKYKYIINNYYSDDISYDLVKEAYDKLNNSTNLSDSDREKYNKIINTVEANIECIAYNRMIKCEQDRVVYSQSLIDPLDLEYPEWAEYSYEAIIEMDDAGVVVPQPILERAHAQQQAAVSSYQSLESQTSDDGADSSTASNDVRTAMKSTIEKSSKNQEKIEDKANELKSLLEDINQSAENQNVSNSRTISQVESFLDGLNELEDLTDKGRKLSNNLNSQSIQIGGIAVKYQDTDLPIVATGAYSIPLLDKYSTTGNLMSLVGISGSAELSLSSILSHTESEIIASIKKNKFLAISKNKQSDNVENVNNDENEQYLEKLDNSTNNETNSVDTAAQTEETTASTETETTADGTNADETNTDETSEDENATSENAQEENANEVAMEFTFTNSIKATAQTLAATIEMLTQSDSAKAAETVVTDQSKDEAESVETIQSSTEALDEEHNASTEEISNLKAEENNVLSTTDTDDAKIADVTEIEDKVDSISKEDKENIKTEEKPIKNEVKEFGIFKKNIESLDVENTSFKDIVESQHKISEDTFVVGNGTAARGIIDRAIGLVLLSTFNYAAGIVFWTLGTLEYFTGAVAATTGVEGLATNDIYRALSNNTNSTLETSKDQYKDESALLNQLATETDTGVLDGLDTTLETPAAGSEESTTENTEQVSDETNQQSPVDENSNVETVANAVIAQKIDNEQVLDTTNQTTTTQAVSEDNTKSSIELQEEQEILVNNILATITTLEPDVLSQLVEAITNKDREVVSKILNMDISTLSDDKLQTIASTTTNFINNTQSTDNLVQETTDTVSQSTSNTTTQSTTNAGESVSSATSNSSAATQSTTSESSSEESEEQDTSYTISAATKGISEMKEGQKTLDDAVQNTNRSQAQVNSMEKTTQVNQKNLDKDKKTLEKEIEKEKKLIEKEQKEVEKNQNQIEIENALMEAIASEVESAQENSENMTEDEKENAQTIATGKISTYNLKTNEVEKLSKTNKKLNTSIKTRAASIKTKSTQFAKKATQVQSVAETSKTTSEQIMGVLNTVSVVAGAIQVATLGVEIVGLGVELIGIGLIALGNAMLSNPWTAAAAPAVQAVGHAMETVGLEAVQISYQVNKYAAWVQAGASAGLAIGYAAKGAFAAAATSAAKAGISLVQAGAVNIPFPAEASTAVKVIEQASFSAAEVATYVEEGKSAVAYFGDDSDTLSKQNIKKYSANASKDAKKNAMQKLKQASVMNQAAAVLANINTNEYSDNDEKSERRLTRFNSDSAIESKKKAKKVQAVKGVSLNAK